jgi:lysophospholipase L1-like esterase
VAYGCGLFLVVLLTAELGARVDDWLHRGVPLLANPSAEYNLQVQDTNGTIRGRPFGQYKRWKLNEFGFRSPPMTKEPTEGRVRVAVLGASETFGLYESAGGEMPAQLARELNGEAVEVFNASITGITVHSMVPYLEGWVSQFRPQIVVLYASPLFYLRDWAAEAKPARATVSKSASDYKAVCPEPALSSRFVSRVKDVVHLPDFIQRYRTRREIDRLTQGQPADWYYRSVPAANLARFRADVDELTTAIRASGAEVLVVTHVLRASSPPRPADGDDLESMRVHLPKATPEVLVAFNREASSAVLDLCHEKQIPVVEAATLDGNRELFCDLVHFNDAGASRLARLTADHLRPLLRKTGDAVAQAR